MKVEPTLGQNVDVVPPAVFNVSTTSGQNVVSACSLLCLCLCFVRKCLARISPMLNVDNHSVFKNSCTHQIRFPL